MTYERTVAAAVAETKSKFAPRSTRGRITQLPRTALFYLSAFRDAGSLVAELRIAARDAGLPVHDIEDAGLDVLLAQQRAAQALLDALFIGREHEDPELVRPYVLTPGAETVVVKVDDMAGVGYAYTTQAAPAGRDTGSPPGGAANGSRGAASKR